MRSLHTLATLIAGYARFSLTPKDNVFWSITASNVGETASSPSSGSNVCGMVGGGCKVCGRWRYHGNLLPWRSI